MCGAPWCSQLRTPKASGRRFAKQKWAEQGNTGKLPDDHHKLARGNSRREREPPSGVCNSGELNHYMRQCEPPVLGTSTQNRALIIQLPDRMGTTDAIPGAGMVEVSGTRLASNSPRGIGWPHFASGTVWYEPRPQNSWTINNVPNPRLRAAFTFHLSVVSFRADAG